MLLDHPLISRRVFHPRPTDHEPDLVVDVGDARLGCHIRNPHPDAGWVLHFHGNGELAAEYAAGGHAEMFTRLGANVCLAEYRGYGRSTGTPALAAMRPDGAAVLPALGADPGRVVVFGRSLGSLYAVELAARVPGLAGLVVESGIADLADVWEFDSELAGIGATRDALAGEAAEAFDQRAKLSAFRGPLLVLHAAGDHLLNRTHAERLHAWGGGADKRLVVFPHGNHNTIFAANLPEYLKELGDFLVRAAVAAPRDAGG